MALRIAAIALVILSAATPAAAQSEASSSEAARSVDDNRVICKKEAKTGTRHQTRTCHTKAEWEEIRLQNQRDLKEMVDRPVICGGGGSTEGC
jgi:hypothetical protein